jgi:hypothetical protein
VDAGCPGRCEVALRGEVGPLVVLDALDELGDDEVEVGVALAVGVRPEAHRDAIKRREEVGSVVEVEAPEEVLVRLPGAAVLGDDEPGHELQHLARAQDGTILHELTGDGPGAGRVGAAHPGLVVAGHDDVLAEPGALGRRFCGIGRFGHRGAFAAFFCKRSVGSPQAWSP